MEPKKAKLKWFRDSEDRETSWFLGTDAWDDDHAVAVISPRWSVSRGPCWYVAVLGGVSLGDFRTLGEAKAAVKAKL